MPDPQNTAIAARLEELAALLESQGANPFRVEAYRHAAEQVRRLERPAGELLRREGIEGFERLPAIGVTIARAIRDLVETGRLPMLDRLRGESDAVTLLASVPGIGRTLAERLHHDHGIDTLEDLEAASHDGRLVAIRSFGEKRLRGVREALATRLGRVPRSAAASPRSTSCCGWTGSIAPGPQPVRSARSRRGASTRGVRRGSRFSIRWTETATSRRCSRTPRGRTISARHASGW